ncbi:hypothetical protein F511_03747 [Dorcoceras hygrometricum]|uniref:RING-type E3 ubiquitin transferase n=1 Tax=Dorcoceras hygrometricum TaxID=472368 RepID=A0A2Z7B523_9LAMI|nr:hypothetical protein F511_03747 [Dorcoceras hygrometricum]
MDAFSGKRSAGGLTKPRKGFNVGLKDAATERDQNIQFCYRIGCSGRIKYSQNTKLGTSDVSKCSKPSIRSLDRNKTYGNSSRSNSVITSVKEVNSDSIRKVSSQVESYSSKVGLSRHSETLEPMPLPNASLTGKLAVTESGSSSASSSIKPQKISQIRSSLHKPNALPGSSIPSVSKFPNPSPSKDACGSRYGLRSLKCNSIPVVVPSSSSSSFSKPVRKNLMNKKIPEREVCLSRRKTTVASSSDGNMSPSSCTSPICDSKNSNHASGEVNSDSTSSRTQRIVNITNRTRLSSRTNMRNSSSARKPASGSHQFSQSGTPINIGGSSSSQQLSANGFLSGSSSYSFSSSNDDYESTLMPLTSGERGFRQFMSHDVLQRYNIDGIAELLLALERIERDEEMTHEQILTLDTSFFLSSLNIHDQHRDMRLDIDNMSYEELLALEDRMGSVSTAVPEEALTNCLRRSIYQVTSSEARASGLDEDGDDIKCSICQEDFALGDEIGALVECEHGYHVTCIYQWLRLKNWCPICKVAAAPSESSSS